MKRPKWSHKGDFGKVLIVGGSKTYVGAPSLAGMAALAAGCDLVTIAAPGKAAWAINTLYPDLITYKLDGNYLEPEHTNEIQKLIPENDALLIGPGLGSRSTTLRAVQKIVNNTTIPTVLDADALKIKKIPRGMVLTPHSTEFYYVFGLRPTTYINQRKDIVKKMAEKSGCIILLKGHVDVISDGKKVLENRTGNPHMTVGGTGDTLAGILVSLLAQKVPYFEAAQKAAEINGKAGDYCLEKEHRVLASKLIEYIPRFV